MSMQNNNGILLRGVTLLMFVLIAVCWANRPAFAQQTVVAKVKVTHWGISSQMLPAPDAKDHVLAIGQREGEVDFDGKESAKYESTAMIDGWIGKKGTYKGYSKYTFKDGSEIFFFWTAEGDRNKMGLATQQGTGTILKGTGRFEGIRGHAVFSTTQLRPASEDPVRTSVADTVIIYTLP